MIISGARISPCHIEAPRQKQELWERVTHDAMRQGCVMAFSSEEDKRQKIQANSKANKLCLIQKNLLTTVRSRH